MINSLLAASKNFIKGSRICHNSRVSEKTASIKSALVEKRLVHSWQYLGISSKMVVLLWQVTTGREAISSFLAVPRNFFKDADFVVTVKWVKAKICKCQVITGQEMIDLFLAVSRNFFKDGQSCCVKSTLAEKLLIHSWCHLGISSKMVVPLWQSSERKGWTVSSQHRSRSN